MSAASRIVVAPSPTIHVVFTPIPRRFISLAIAKTRRLGHSSGSTLVFVKLLAEPFTARTIQRIQTVLFVRFQMC